MCIWCSMYYLFFHMLHKACVYGTYSVRLTFSFQIFQQADFTCSVTFLCIICNEMDPVFSRDRIAVCSHIWWQGSMLSIWKYSPGLPFLAPSWLWATYLSHSVMYDAKLWQSIVCLSTPNLGNWWTQWGVMMMRVMVWHFVSNAHKFMTPLMFVLPSNFCCGVSLHNFIDTQIVLESVCLTSSFQLSKQKENTSTFNSSEAI